MKICFLSIVTYWHGLRGGMDLHGKYLLDGLASKGHKITVLSTSHPSGLEYEEKGKIRIHYLKNTIFGSSRKGWRRESAKNLQHILEREKIDVMVSQAAAGYGICGVVRKNFIPLATIMHGYETMILRSLFNQVRNFREGYANLVKNILVTAYCTTFQEYPLLLNSSLIIAVSDRVSRVLRRRPFVPKGVIKTITPGIDLSIFRPSPSIRERGRREIGLKDTDQVALFMSLLSRQKGADIVIRAFKSLRNREQIKLIVAGDGEYLAEAKQLAKRLGLETRILFPGFVEHRDTPLYYNIADIFVFPTLRLESFGLVLAEAMACEKPIIASRIGSTSEVVDHGENGLLILPGDPRALAIEIARLLDDQNYARMLARNARRKAVKRFGLEKMVDKTEKELETLVTIKRSRK